MGWEVFKGEGDMCDWVECNLPYSYPFCIFVNVHVIMELILIGHTNVQAQTMEHIMKLNLQANRALVLKTFEQKLPTLSGRAVSDSNTTRIVILFKDTCCLI
eukprot:11191694-Ditylum_brightwellii.AAC.1